ncbi:hypothetical protein C1J03_16895 [Sulfitobacter sp. SK012]|uniref:hypothetical protein n=1 Tax=Sulfitobacter sp. SK012 TaxID=1389005 RepID=UPI000E0C15C9|nr:hypothetical protein [Sulfitobacter sp. SK012]AXI47533.1 hypothetical protein C1J03_16895 [Sulfitobacter sp. SK012]
MSTYTLGKGYPIANHKNQYSTAEIESEEGNTIKNRSLTACQNLPQPALNRTIDDGHDLVREAFDRTEETVPYNPANENPNPIKKAHLHEASKSGLGRGSTALPHECRELVSDGKVMLTSKFSKGESYASTPQSEPTPLFGILREAKPVPWERLGPLADPIVEDPRNRTHVDGENRAPDETRITLIGWEVIQAAFDNPIEVCPVDFMDKNSVKRPNTNRHNRAAELDEKPGVTK